MIKNDICTTMLRSYSISGSERDAGDDTLEYIAILPVGNQGKEFVSVW